MNQQNNPEIFTLDFRAMGTDVSVEIILAEATAGERSRAATAAEAVRNIFTKNEKIFSRFNPDSELSNLNKNIGKETFISREMSEVLDLCLKFNNLSEGYFDPRVIGTLEKIGYDKDFKTNDLNHKEKREIAVEKIEGALAGDVSLNPGKQSVIIRKRIDTTGIAKGYTVDEAAQSLRRAGFENFIVDAGGDMQIRGKDRGKKEWRIGIEGLEDDKLMLALSNAGVATSGISRKRWTVGGKKFHHLINPKDPENFSYDVKTVTVIEAKTVEADGQAKVLVLMGKEKGLQFANDHGIKALFLDYKGTVYLSEKIKEYVLK